MKKKFFDTSSLLVNCSDLSDVVISSVTIRELEHIKVSSHKDEETKYRSRMAVRAIKDQKPEVVVVIEDDYKMLVDMKLESSNDNLIIACAKRYSENHEVEFYSEDFLCALVAEKFFCLNVNSVGDRVKDDIYKGYIEFTGNEDEINGFMNSIDMSKLYCNQYIILNNTSTGKSSEMRFDGKQFVNLKLPNSSYIKGKNAKQRCALDLLTNKDVDAVAILGTYGSGKTFLATQMALYYVNEKGTHSKVLGVREPKGEGASVGYLPGDIIQKTGMFFKPIEQQLKGGEFELNSLVQRGVLESQIPFYLKGCSYSDTIMVVDEAEDLTDAQIRLVGTRLAENSRIFFSGDYGQSVINKTQTNPLVKMCNELKGNTRFGCMYLDDDVRSEASKMFADLFK